MLRVPIDKAHMKRSFGALYGWTQMTPKDQFLDPAWDRSVPIYPGMVAMKTEGENVTLANADGDPLGFFGLYVGGDGIDELREVGINAIAVWVMGPDAEAYVDAPAFDADVAWEESGDGTTDFVHYYTAGANRGRLCPAGADGASSKPVARLLKVNGPGRITIGGLHVVDAVTA